jgi:hypothetical protein
MTGKAKSNAKCSLKKNFTRQALGLNITPETLR